LTTPRAADLNDCAVHAVCPHANFKHAPFALTTPCVAHPLICVIPVADLTINSIYPNV
jgi:hypothetical protein